MHYIMVLHQGPTRHAVQGQPTFVTQQPGAKGFQFQGVKTCLVPALLSEILPASIPVARFMLRTCWNVPFEVRVEPTAGHLHPQDHGHCCKSLYIHYMPHMQGIPLHLGTQHFQSAPPLFPEGLPHWIGSGSVIRHMQQQPRQNNRAPVDTQQRRADTQPNSTLPVPQKTSRALEHPSMRPCGPLYTACATGTFSCHLFQDHSMRSCVFLLPY